MRSTAVTPMADGVSVELFGKVKSYQSAKIINRPVFPQANPRLVSACRIFRDPASYALSVPNPIDQGSGLHYIACTTPAGGYLGAVPPDRGLAPPREISVAAMDSAPAVVPRLLYAPAEAETLLGVSHATLYRLIRAGRLDARKIGARTGITAASIERLVAELPSAGRAA